MRNVLIEIDATARQRQELNMNTFEMMAEAQIAAAEGQRQMARALSDWTRRVARRWLDAVARHAPERRAQPW